MNFELILVTLTFITGVLYFLDKFIFEKQRIQTAAQTNQPVKINGMLDFGRSFFPVILSVVLLRSFLVEPFRIPSGSMIPTLHVGDFILVNKFTYGLRLPVLHTKITEGKLPERGDVIVFRYPPEPKNDFIKRVVGLPGDEVAYADKHVYINGKLLTESQAVPFKGDAGTTEPALLSQEDLLGYSHSILKIPSRNDNGLNGRRYTVPDGHYFVMGDNRDNSSDSRYWGFVPEENLVGKAFFIWMSCDFSQFSCAFDRIGSKIH